MPGAPGAALFALLNAHDGYRDFLLRGPAFLLRAYFARDMALIPAPSILLHAMRFAYTCLTTIYTMEY